MSVWKGFRESKAGAGSITYYANNQAARLKSEATSGDRATLYYEPPAIPGTTYQLVYKARITDGSGATAPFGAVDYPSTGNLVDRFDYTNEWREYVTTFTVPYDADPEGGDIVAFAIGVFTAQLGELEITRPVITVVGSQQPPEVGFVRDVLYLGNGIWNADVPMGSKLWTNYDQIWIYASQNSTGTWARGNSIMIDCVAFAASGADTYVQMVANTGSSTALSHKVDVQIRPNGTIRANATSVGNEYYIRAVVGYKFPWTNA
jgi:hypothetical protein